jgi:hypothetical protein
MRSLASIAVCAALAAPAVADTTVQGHKKADNLTGQVLGYALDLLADRADRDDRSPVKAEVEEWVGGGYKAATAGVRDYQGSITLVRGALSYGVVRSAGQTPTVPRSWGGGALNHELIAAVYSFHDPENLATLEKAFTKLFGRPLVKKRTGEGEAAVVEYDAAALEAAFRALYVKPASKIGGLEAQVLYDTFFRRFVRRVVAVVAAAEKQPGFLAAQAKVYRAQASTKGFDGYAFIIAATKQLPAAVKDEHRLVGTVIRRQADGTLPTLKRLLRALVTDYDPEAAKTLPAG